MSKDVEIVVVEDSPTPTFHKHYFDKWGYPGASFFTNPEDAARALEQGDVDILLTDDYFPGSTTTGADLARLAKEKNPLCKVLLISGILAKKPPGVDILLSKPVSFSMLQANFEALICALRSVREAFRPINSRATVPKRAFAPLLVFAQR